MDPPPPPPQATDSGTRPGVFSLTHLPFSPAQNRVILQTGAGGMDASVMDAPRDGLPVRFWARGGSGRERSLIKCRCSQR